MTPCPPEFPFDVLEFRGFPGELGEFIRALEAYSLHPPYPWGQWLYARIIRDSLAGFPGDFVELGVGRGGMSVFLARLAKAQRRRVFSFDSFEGLPDPDPLHDNVYFRRGFYSSTASAEPLLDRFRAALRMFDVADVVIPVAGYFSDTLPAAELGEIAFLHIDADLYESVYQSLDTLYDKVTPGGVIVVDDFFHPAQGPARALADFLNARGLHPVLHVSFPYTVFLVKGDPSSAARRRAIDGNMYSLEYLGNDRLFLDVLAAPADRDPPEAGPRPRSAENKHRLHALLTDQPGDGSEIYEYWRCLENFWQHIDYRPRNEATWTI